VIIPPRLVSSTGRVPTRSATTPSTTRPTNRLPQYAATHTPAALSPIPRPWVSSVNAHSPAAISTAT
jgi:hypothetical protein